MCCRKYFGKDLGDMMKCGRKGRYLLEWMVYLGICEYFGGVSGGILILIVSFCSDLEFVMYSKYFNFKCCR